MKKRFMHTFYLTGILLYGIQIFADGNGAMSRVYGDYFINEFEQRRSLGVAGSLDLTFGQNGTFNCSGALPGGQVRALQILPNGSIVAALSKSGFNSVVVQYNYIGMINSNFGTAGRVDLGSLSSTIQSMTLDGQGRMLIAGGNDTSSGTAGWLSRVNYDGSNLVSFAGGLWRFIGAVGQQSTGNIIAVGFDNNFAQIARYTQGTYATAGLLDTTFGTNGIISFDGSGLLPAITNGLYSVVIDARDLIYVTYVAKDNNVYVARFTQTGQLDRSFAINGIALIPSLQNATPSQLRMALDSNNNLILAAQVGSYVKVASILAASGTQNSSFTPSIISGAQQGSLTLQSLMITTDNTILLIGNNQTTLMNRVTRLTGDGVLDTTFCGTGSIEFTIPQSSQARLCSAAVAGDGRIYLAGSHLIDGGVHGCIASMYNDAYAMQVPQFPLIAQQGTCDKSFGSATMYPGVVTPFDGLYGVALMQRARSITELASKNILVGMDGYLETSNNSNMILTRLTPAGALDTTFASGSGKIALPLHQTNEYISSIFEDKATNLYVVGYGDTGSIIRQYSNQGAEQWVADIRGTSYQAFDVIQQNSNRMIVCGQTSSTQGIITAHLVATGAIDTTFNARGTQPGKILATDFGLNMGPVINGIINAANVIFVAYKNSNSGGIDVAAFYGDGSGLVSNFGTGGVVSNLFGSTAILPNNVRIAFDQNYNLIVAASCGFGIVVALCGGETGLLDTTFSNAGILSIPSLGRSINIKTIMGLSDGSIVLTAQDNATDDAMLLLRVASGGVLDTTFNPQGVMPGVASIKVGNRAQVYKTRMVTDACIQSTTGNILLTGYEELMDHDATPMVMRFLGQFGTNEIQGFKTTSLYPGMLDTTFSMNGSMPLDSQISIGAAKTIYAYRSNDINQGKILVGIDTGATVKISRMNALSMALDQNFATNGVITLPLLTGLQHLSLDARAHILISGSSAGQGWLKRLTPSGSLDLSAVMPSNIASVNRVYQQKSGRYIAACNDINGNGVIVAWQDRLVGSNSSLLVDTTFNPLGVVPGQVVIGSTGLYSLAINNDDTILAAYAAGTVKVVLLSANGAGLVTSFGSLGTINTSITPKNPSEVRLAIDTNNKIIVASTALGQNKSIRRSLELAQKSPSPQSGPNQGPNGPKPGQQGPAGQPQNPAPGPQPAPAPAPAPGGKPNQGPAPIPAPAPTQSNVVLQVVRYLPSGQLDTTFNGNGSLQVISNIGSAGVCLAHCMTTNEISGQDKIILLGCNSAGANGPMFAVRLAGNGSFDATWNPLGVKNDTPGVLTYAVDNAITMLSGSIAIDGAIYCSGIAANNAPLVMRIVGDSYITESEQQPFEVAAGKLDTTIDVITPGSGALNLNLALGMNIGTPAKLYLYQNEGGFIASNYNGATYITKFTATGACDTTFNQTGVVVIPNASLISDMYLANGANDDGSLYLTGMNNGSVWFAKISASGLLTVFSLPGSSALTSVSAIRKTMNGRILLAGQTNTSGVIVAYTSDGSSLDLSFGVGLGYYATGIPTNLNTFELDGYDRIYIAYKDTTDGTVKIKRITSNGAGVDSSFSTGVITQTFGLSSTQISLALDRVNQQIIVAVQDGVGAGNIIKVSRFNMATGVQTGSIANITIPSNILKLSNICIDALQNIYVIGSNLTNNNSYIARINSTNATTLTLDANYGVGGIANLATGSLTSVASGALDKDRRMYLLGNDASGIAYLARFFGDVYSNQLINTASKAITGTNDLSLDTTESTIDGGVTLSNLANWSGIAGYIARSVQANKDGSSYIAFGNGTNLIVGLVDADMNPIGSFGINGLTASLPMAVVNSLIVDSSGKILVCGVQSGVQAIIRFTKNGSVDTVFTGNLASTSATAIAEQTSGRLLVSGQIGSLGAIFAYKNTGVGIDGSFGPASLQGYYTNGVNTQIDDLVIDNNDSIYFVYRNNANRACLGKLMANGADLDRSFNNGAIIDTGIVSSQTQPVRIAINNMGNVLVAVTTSSFVQTSLYNGQSGTVISSVQTILSGGCPVVTKVVGSGADFIGSAYTLTNNMIVFKISGLTGCLDNGFGLLQNGISSSNPNNALAVYGLSVGFDGKIAVVGTARLTPILMRVYGYPYLPQYQQMPAKVAAGNVDMTLNSGAQGILTLSAVPFAGYTIKKLYGYNNGSMLAVCDNGNNTIVTRLLKDFSLDTANFNSPMGYVTLSGNANVTGLHVNQNGAIYVTGGLYNPWTVSLQAHGAPSVGWMNPLNNGLSGTLSVGQQSLQRVIVAGLGSAGGCLYAYTPTGSLDREFGMGSGMISTGIAAPIAAMSINNLDQIFIAYVHNGTSVLQRVSADGGMITNLNAGTSITGIINNEIKLVQDLNGNIIVAAGTNNGLTLRRYTSAGVNNGLPVVIPATSGNVAHLANLYTTSDGKIVVVGYESVSGNIVVARMDANFVFDQSWNSGSPVVVRVGDMNTAHDAFVGIDDRVMIACSNGNAPTASCMRIYGDDYVAALQQSPLFGSAGTVDRTFGLSGAVTLSSLGNGLLNLTQAKAVVPLANGGHYVALNNGTTSSKLIYVTAENSLYSSFGIAGIAADTLDGVESMIQTGSRNLLLVGTTASGLGWISRYNADNSGQLDRTFNATGTVTFGQNCTARVVGEQTLARIIIAGKDARGNGVVRALTNTGNLDTTFNANVTPGLYNTGIATEIFALAIDQFDRIIIAYQNGSSVDLVRLHAHGVIDQSFGLSGIISGAILGADQIDQVALVINTAGNIILAAHTLLNGVQAISIKGYDNLSAASGNGALVNGQYDLTGLVSPELKNLVATQDGKVLVLGNQSGTNPAWIARCLCPYYTPISLDTNFNDKGTVAGIMTYAGFGVTNHSYVASAVRPDGRIVMVGNEDLNPMIVRVYNNPYVIEMVQSPNARPVGTNDVTLGWTNNSGVAFFATPSSAVQKQQKAQAIALQDNNNLLIALDGQVPGSSDNYMFLNMFDVSGLPNQNFGTAGKLTLPHNYQSEHVQDMYSFSTAVGINKALLVGYATNPILNATGSLMMQYNTSLQSVDNDFGGLNGNPAGVVFGDAIQYNSVSRQSMGRIVVVGAGLDGRDVILGYTPTGLLDQSFGTGGSLSFGTNPLYVHVIDAQNRIIIAYNDGNNNVAVARILANGSGIDTTFGNNGFVTSKISGISGNSNMKIALDNNGNIIVAAATNRGAGCTLIRYLPSGARDVSLSLSAVQLAGITNFVLSKLLVDLQGKIIMVGTDQNATENKVVIARTLSNLSALDSTFNQGQTPGYITYALCPGMCHDITDAIIHPDGRIVVVGCQN